MVAIATLFQKHLIINIGMGLAALLIATPATASVLTYQGDTTNQPTWLRTAPGTPPIRVSGSDAGPGMRPPYNAFEFVVEESGLYTFASTVPGATLPTNGAWDNFLVLYQNSFNPTDQLNNALVSINAPNNGTFAFNQQLNTGQNYFLVTTGRQSTDFGAFTNTISGSGKITKVPEPALTLGMLTASGIALILYKGKRIRITGS